MLERELEKYFKNLVESTGAYCFKFTSPGTRGVPDRIVVARSGIYFVELKRPKGGRLSSHQIRWQEKFKALGQTIHLVKNREEAEAFAERYLT